MRYESLLLDCGGGILSDTQKSPQYTGAATLCIGIGGTGIAALCSLKEKVHHHLQPDHPDEPIPRYDGIQFLGIDSDDIDYKRYHDNGRLSEEEFVSIRKENLCALLTDAKGKSLIRNDPRLNWMEIDRITSLLSPVGAGCVRQMGRYMLMDRAADVASAIESKAAAALEKRGSTELDVYIFTGLSGGTGSGCFLDICYLIRKVAEHRHWNVKLIGLFFLPDVTTSQRWINNSFSDMVFHNANGYAALKELDYLMDLPAVNDWFEQNYGSFQIRTQEPPVDMCCLISARAPNGRPVPDGFRCGIGLASDYVLYYLADNGYANNDPALSMRGCLANMGWGLQAIPRRYGANLSYHILGASQAEIPMNQFNTYLAAGFFKKFRTAAYREKKAITKDIVQRFMEENRFTVRDVYGDVIRNSPTLELVDIDRKALSREPCCPKNELPRIWADQANDWLCQCEAVHTRNAQALNRKLESYNLQDANDETLIGRLFRKLWELSVDPAYGPYYAAALLNNYSHDLLGALAGAVSEANEKAEVQAFHVPHRADYKVECNQALINSKIIPLRRCYHAFKDSAEDLIRTINTEQECRATAKVLSEFLSQVKALHKDFFRPLCAMLDNLNETFEANVTYLQTPEAKAPNAYTWQILNLDDVKDKLDEAVQTLEPNTMVNAFVTYLLNNSGSWLDNKPEQVAELIRDYILHLFNAQTNHSLEDYLYELYDARNIPELAEKVKDNILKRVDRSAVPMFWCDPTYDITRDDVTFSHDFLIVPGTAPAIWNAANQFRLNNGRSYAVRTSGLNDRIFALNVISGVPLFAYQGITMLKDAYDAAATGASGIGIHLYACTGRGSDGSGYKDWRKLLPTPMPYSKVKGADKSNLVPDGPALEELYRKAAAEGILCRWSGEYGICVSSGLSVRDYRLEDFLNEQGQFSRQLHDNVLQELCQTLQNLHDPNCNPDCHVIPLKNDGNRDFGNPEDVRIDHFIRAPMLQKAVREELKKQEALHSMIAQVRAIREEYEAYTRDLETFSHLLFYRMVDCFHDKDNISYDKTRFVTCELEDRSYYFLCNQWMPFSRYPLYQAFRSYRFLADPDRENTERLDLVYYDRAALKKLRRDLDEKQAEYHNRRRVDDDCLVPAILEQVWSADALRELRHVTLSNERAEVQQDVYRFYNGLRTIVSEFKRRSATWPQGLQLKELHDRLSKNLPAKNFEPRKPLDFAWIYDGSRMLEYHPGMCSNQAFDRENNLWVPLHTGMYIYLHGQWTLLNPSDVPTDTPPSPPTEQSIPPEEPTEPEDA